MSILDSLKNYTGKALFYPSDCGDEVKEIANKIYPETISISAYYAERLKWWKRQFNKKPEKHQLIIDMNNGSNNEVIEFENLSDAQDVLNGFREKMNTINLKVFPTNINGKVIGIAFVDLIYIIEGHPDPYTPEEIETWAKEQLEQEMQEWKVIKLDYTEPLPTPGIVTMITEQVERERINNLFVTDLIKKGYYGPGPW